VRDQLDDTAAGEAIVRSVRQLTTDYTKPLSISGKCNVYFSF